MMTTVQIEQILRSQRAKKVNNKNGFDTALIGLGIALKEKRQKSKK